jgi:hypothetical protein
LTVVSSRPTQPNGDINVGERQRQQRHRQRGAGAQQGALAPYPPSIGGLRP